MSYGGFPLIGQWFTTGENTSTSARSNDLADVHPACDTAGCNRYAVVVNYGKRWCRFHYDKENDKRLLDKKEKS